MIPIATIASAARCAGSYSKSGSPRLGIVALALAVLAQGGCASVTATGSARSESNALAFSPDPGTRSARLETKKADSTRLAQEGVASLRRGDTDKALRLFNAAIKFDSENGAYHLLAGLGYHLKYLAAGSPELRDEAVIGYQLASRYQPLDARPKIQLGRLYVDAHDAPQAKEAFADAVSLAPENLDALEGLATSSYLVGDLKTALWAAQEMENRGADRATLDRFRAIFYAALGDEQNARSSRDHYAVNKGVGANSPRQLDERLTRIRTMLDTRNWSVQPGASDQGLMHLATERFVVAQNAAPSSPTAQSQGLALGQGQAASAPLSPSVGSAMGASGPKLAGDSVDPWWVCRNTPPPSSPLIAKEQPPSADETTPLSALPSPCVGAAPPRSVIIDAVLLRTDDEISRSYGLNVLQGLTGFFGYAANFAKVGSAASQATRTAQFGLGIPVSSTSAPLSYSLNIANATVNRTYVIARPTLMAIDRIPSTFFSGDTVSLAVGGGVAGAVSSLVDKQIGLSFSITPTFLDDEHVLLSVKVVGSYFAVPSAGTTGVALQQSRSAVNASLVAGYGETVILSGLTQRDQTRSQSGAPLLQNVPGLQYAFSQSQPLDDYETVMVMISLRKPEVVTRKTDIASLRAAALAGKAHSFDWRVDDYEKKISATLPGLESSLATLTTNELYRGFMAGDLADSRWDEPGKLDALTRQILEAVVH